jgi:hypothetical protein
MRRLVKKSFSIFSPEGKKLLTLVNDACPTFKYDRETAVYIEGVHTTFKVDSEKDVIIVGRTCTIKEEVYE